MVDLITRVGKTASHYIIQHCVLMMVNTTTIIIIQHINGKIIFYNKGQ